MVRAKCLCMMVFSLLTNDVAFGDAYLEYKSFPSGRISFYLTSRYVRMDTEEHGVSPFTVIYDKNERTIFILYHEKKSYAEVNEKLLKDLRRMREKMEAQLSNLPPPMREIGKQMMMPGCRKIEKIPSELCEGPNIIGTEMFQGFTAKVVDGCKNFDVEKNSFVACRYWFVDGEKLNLNSEDFKTLSAFLEFEWEVVKAMGSFCGMEPISMLLATSEKTLVLGYDLPIPVKALSVSDGKEETKMILDKVVTKGLSQEAFRLPKDYKKMEIGVSGLR